MNNIIKFFNEEFKTIRATEINGVIYFCGKDVCSAFGDKNHNRSLKRVDDEDKRTVGVLDSLGRKQKAVYVNESGLYSLLFSMQPQKANNNGVTDAYPIEIQERIDKLRRFKHWVTSEVLPAIRKHGMYAVDELLDNPDLAIKALTDMKLQRKQIGIE